MLTVHAACRSAGDYDQRYVDFQAKNRKKKNEANRTKSGNKVI
jgi:hypothetical protein